MGTYSLVQSIEHQNISPNNLFIPNLKNSHHHISEDLKIRILNLNHKSPPVGSYSPESKNCIEYDCNKKNRQNSGRKVPFLAKEERFFKLNNKKDYSNDIGKYNILNKKKEMKQQKVPFCLSEEKNKKINIYNYNIGNNNNLGPGVYRNGSYFDWIKKSYNKYFT